MRPTHAKLAIVLISASCGSRAVTPRFDSDAGIDASVARDSGTAPLSDASSPDGGHGGGCDGEWGECAVLDVGGTRDHCDVGYAGTASITHPLPAGATSIATYGDFAYVTTTDARLLVIDVTDADEPRAEAIVDLPAVGTDVDVTGDVAWVACPDAGLVAVDVSSPCEPLVVSRLELAGQVERLRATCEHVFVTEGLNGIEVVDRGDPLAPQRLASLDVGSYALSLALVDDSTLLVGTNSALVVVDASVPEQPVVRGSQPMERPVGTMIVVDDTAYLGNEDPPAGIRVVDVSSPDEPQLLDWREDTVPVVEFVVFDHFVFWSPGWTELGREDLCDPTNCCWGASGWIVCNGMPPGDDVSCDIPQHVVGVGIRGDVLFYVFDRPELGIESIDLGT